MKSLLQIIIVALCLLTLPIHASPTYLEWQPPHLANEQNNLKTRFSATSKHRNSSLTVKTQIQLTSQAYQQFVVCAEHVASDTPAFVMPLDEEERKTYSYQLVITEPETTLELLHPKACTVDNGTYPYHFLDLVHSEKPFLAIENSPKDGKKKESFSGAGLPPSQHQPTEITFSGGVGYGFDDDQQHKKRPPWMSFQTSDPYSLMLLPTLKLPEELRHFLPGTGLYYDLMEQLGYGEDINIVLRVDGNDPVSIPVHRSERAELVEHMTSATALMNWLAPRLNGREELVSRLLDMQTYLGAGATDAEKEFLQAVEKQLAAVLEQTDKEFTLELETYSLMAAMADANENKPAGFVPASGPDTDIVYEGDEVASLMHQYGGKKKGCASRGACGSGTGSTGSTGSSDRSIPRNRSTDREGDSSEHDGLGPYVWRQEGSASNQTTPVVFKIFGGRSTETRMTVANGIVGFEYFNDYQQEFYINPPATFIVQVIHDETSSNNEEDHKTNVVLINIDSDRRYTEKYFSYISKCFRHLRGCVDSNTKARTIDRIDELSTTEEYKPNFTPLYDFIEKGYSVRKEHLKSLWFEVRKLYMAQLPGYLQWGLLNWSWKYNNDRELAENVREQIKRVYKSKREVDEILVRAGLKSTVIDGEIDKKNRMYVQHLGASTVVEPVAIALRLGDLLPLFCWSTDLTGGAGGAGLQNTQRIEAMIDPVILTTGFSGDVWHAFLMCRANNFCLHITNGDAEPAHMNIDELQKYMGKGKNERKITGAISVRRLLGAYGIDYEIHEREVTRFIRELCREKWIYKPYDHNCMTFCMKIFEATNLNVSSYLTGVHSPKCIITSLAREPDHRRALFCYDDKTGKTNDDENLAIIPDILREHANTRINPRSPANSIINFICRSGFAVCAVAGAWFIYTYAQEYIENYQSYAD